jgi:hypothetical protein
MEGQTDTNTKLGFFSYVFNFDDTNKPLLLNLFQYSFLAIPFVVLILKLANYYTPEEDDTKGTLEIISEVITSVSIILLSIWFINRIIRYIPTYSKMDYAVFNETNFIIPLFIILFTMQTKIGAKINILVERIVDLYDGKTNLKTNTNTNQKRDYKTTQPISQPPSHQPSRSDFLNNSQMQAPTQQQAPPPPQHQQQQPAAPQQMAPEQNFNSSYAGPNTPLVDASEPMAANEAFGGNMFGGGSLF